MKSPTPEFQNLFDTYHDRLKRFIAVTIKDEWAADDILQEAFLRVHAKRESLKDHRKIGSWLFQMAYRLCLDRFRKNQRQPEEIVVADWGIEKLYTATVESRLAQHQMGQCVQNQMLRLPEGYRSVVWLFDVLGFTLQETADILEISLVNVKVRLHRARQKLKTILVENCSFEKDERNVLVCEPQVGFDWRDPDAL